MSWGHCGEGTHQRPGTGNWARTLSVVIYLILRLFEFSVLNLGLKIHVKSHLHVLNGKQRVLKFQIAFLEETGGYSADSSYKLYHLFRSIKSSYYPTSICVLSDFWDPLAKDIERLWNPFPVFLMGPFSGSWVSKELLYLFVWGHWPDTERWSCLLYLHIDTQLQFQKSPLPPCFWSCSVLVFCRTYVREIICCR